MNFSWIDGQLDRESIMSLIQEVREEIGQLRPDAAELRKFSWVVGGVFLLIGAFLLYKESSWWPGIGGLGAVLVAVGTIAPKVLRPFYYAWMTLAVVMGYFVTRILLGVFFFLVLTPVGLFFRLIGRDILKRRPDREAESYWETKEYPIADRTRYEKFF